MPDGRKQTTQKEASQFTVKRRMKERLQYLSGINSSLHNGEVVSVQNCVHVRDLPSEDTASSKTQHKTCLVSIHHKETVLVQTAKCKINIALGSLTVSVYLL